MRKPIVILLLALGAGAQAPAPQAAPPPPSTKRVLFAALGGAVAGGLIGARGLNFSALPAAERAPHRWRAGLTYGAIGGVLGAAIAARSEPGEPPPHRFFWDKWNTPLFTGVVAVQALDFASTRYFRERGKDEYLLTNTLVDDRPAFVATELSAASAAIGLSYLFHHGGHHRLERWVAGAYIAVGILSAAANYRYPRTGHGLFGN